MQSDVDRHAGGLAIAAERQRHPALEAGELRQPVRSHQLVQARQPVLDVGFGDQRRRLQKRCPDSLQVPVEDHFHAFDGLELLFVGHVVERHDLLQQAAHAFAVGAADDLVAAQRVRTLVFGQAVGDADVEPWADAALAFIAGLGRYRRGSLRQRRPHAGACFPEQPGLAQCVRRHHDDRRARLDDLGVNPLAPLLAALRPSLVAGRVADLDQRVVVEQLEDRRFDRRRVRTVGGIVADEQDVAVRHASHSPFLRMVIPPPAMAA